MIETRQKTIKLMNKKSPEEIADEMIKIMLDAGLDWDSMLEVIRIVKDRILE